MPASERITWTACPVCSERAAVGWRDAQPVEFDCVNGCGLPVDRLAISVGGAPPDASSPAADG